MSVPLPPIFALAQPYVGTIGSQSIATSYFDPTARQTRNVQMVSLSVNWLNYFNVTPSNPISVLVNVGTQIGAFRTLGGVVIDNSDCANAVSFATYTGDVITVGAGEYVCANIVATPNDLTCLIALASGGAGIGAGLTRLFLFDVMPSNIAAFRTGRQTTRALSTLMDYPASTSSAINVTHPMGAKSIRTISLCGVCSGTAPLRISVYALTPPHAIYADVIVNCPATLSSFSIVVPDIDVVMTPTAAAAAGTSSGSPDTVYEVITNTLDFSAFVARFVTTVYFN